MKNLILFFLIFSSLSLFSNKRYWVGGGSNANWNASPTTNWAATSGGTTRVAAPTTTDSIYFDGAGTNGNTNSTISANIVIGMYTVSAGYTRTITHGAYLSVTGNITLHSGFTLAGPVALQSTGGGIITTGGKTINVPFNFLTSTAARTINGNMTVSGILTFGVSNLVVNATTNETITSSGGLNALAVVTGTVKLVITAGMWTGGTSNYLGINTDIQGNISLGGTGVGFGGTATLTYVSGTVTQNNATIALFGSPTLDLDGITWYSISANTTSLTVTFAATLTATTITLNSQSSATMTFAGSYGFITDNLIIESIAGNTITLANGITYQVNSSFSCYKSRMAQQVSFTSDHVSNKAILHVAYGASCNILSSFTRIDASSGRSLATFNGTITDCLNIFECHDCFGSTIGG